MKWTVNKATGIIDNFQSTTVIRSDDWSDINKDFWTHKHKDQAFKGKDKNKDKDLTLAISTMTKLTSLLNRNDLDVLNFKVMLYDSNEIELNCTK